MITTPLVKKYRPKTIDNILTNDITKTLLRCIVDKKMLNNTIFIGPPGTGKTSSLQCIVRQILGKHKKIASLSVNGNGCDEKGNGLNERGIKVKEIIASFCQKQIQLHDEKEEPIPFKIVVLDEIDSMTDKAQQGIAELMEEYKNTVRFICTCNNSLKVIDKVQDVCSIVRYSGITRTLMLERLKEICKLEEIKFAESGLKMIVHNSHGDMRQALNDLELVQNSYKNVNETNVNKVCYVPQADAVTTFLKHCYKKELKNMHDVYNQLREKGNSNLDIINSIIDYVQISTGTEIDKDEDYKIRFLSLTNDTLVIITKNIDTYLQMSGYFCRICSLR